MRKANLALLIALLPLSAHAQSKNFDFKDPKEISAVSLKINSMLEPIVGYARGISGTLQFDPKHPELTRGTIQVEAKSLVFAHEGYTQTARNYALNSDKYAQLSLTIRKVESGKIVGPNRWRGVVLADFTCRNITKVKRLVVDAALFPGKAEERTDGQYLGDVLVVRTSFNVSRTEHGISEGIPGNMVADKIEVGVAVVGMAAVKASGGQQ